MPLDMRQSFRTLKLGDLGRRPQSLARADLEHRSDIYRDIEVEDPASKDAGAPPPGPGAIRSPRKPAVRRSIRGRRNDTGGLLRPRAGSLEVESTYNNAWVRQRRRVARIARFAERDFSKYSDASFRPTGRE